MLMTCIKYCQNAIYDEAASSLEALEVSWCVAKAAVLLTAETDRQPSSSSSSSSNDSCRTLAGVVVARSLHLTSQCFAVLLKNNAALARADVRLGATMPANERMKRLLQELTETLGFISNNLQQQQQQQGFSLAADSKGAIRQQLQQQVEALQQGVQQAQQRSSSGSRARSQTMAAVAKAVLDEESLVQQLQELSELLCANLLPQGPLWCNNPSCRYGHLLVHQQVHL
jgi:hypothetical protein